MATGKNWRSQHTVWLQELQHPEGKDSTLGIAYAWSRLTTPMTTWPPKTQSNFHTKHMNLNTWIDGRVIPRAQSSSQVLVVMICTLYRGPIWVVRISHVIDACSEGYSSTLSSPFHPTSSSSHSSSNLLQSLLHFFHKLEGSSNTGYFDKKGDGVLWRLLLPHNNISEILERLQCIRTDAESVPKIGVSIVFSIEFAMFVHLTWLMVARVCCSQTFPFGFCFFEKVMDSLSSSVSTVPSPDDDFEHNMWNHLLELLFFEQVCGILASFVFHPRLPFRASPTTSSTTCGILFWNYFSSSRQMYCRLLFHGIRHGRDRAVFSLCCWFTLLRRRRVWVCMMLHRALVSMEFSFPVGTMAFLATLWFFCGWCIRYKILPGTYSPYWTRSLWYCAISLCGDWWTWRCTSPRELFRCLCAASCRTRSRIEVFLKTVSFMTVHSRCINGEAMVLFRPFSLQLPCSLSKDHREVYSILFFCWVAAGIQPYLQVRLFQGVGGLNPKYVQSGSLRRFSFSLGLKSAGVAPLPPCCRKLLDETFKTFAVYPRGCTFSMVKTIACCPYH